MADQLTQREVNEAVMRALENQNKLNVQIIKRLEALEPPEQRRIARCQTNTGK